MNKNIRTEFGFKTVNVGSITIYTGKIRIKGTEVFIRAQLWNYMKQLQFSERFTKNAFYTTICFETTNAALNKELMYAIMEMMRGIAHDRIDSKYNMYTPELKETVIESLMDF